jgi:hypothetical protein
MSEPSDPRWVTPERLRASGWSRAQMRSATRKGEFTRDVRGLWLPSHAADDLYQRCARALATQREDAAISRQTAAVIRDFAWVPDAWAAPSCDIDITVARDDLSRSTRQGIDRRIADLPPEDVVIWRGLRVTSPARTAVDIARYEKSRLLAVQLLDGVLRFEHCSREDMVACITRMVRVPWVQRGRERIALAAEGVDSPPETTVRLYIVDAGLPSPDVNLRLSDGDVQLAQGDLGYWRWLIWIEYDGEEVHIPLRMDGKDQRKDRWLGRRGWEPFRLTHSDVKSPAGFLNELGAAIAEAPARVAALDPARSPEVARAHQLLGIA